MTARFGTPQDLRFNSAPRLLASRSLFRYFGRSGRGCPSKPNGILKLPLKALITFITVSAGALLLAGVSARAFAAGIDRSIFSRNPAATRPFDQLQTSLKPWLDERDPFAMPMKMRSLAGSPYQFWRGGRMLFFKWCAIDAPDWLGDHDATMICHGDPHFGNMGLYPTGADGFSLALGMVDFDDSHSLPFQYELLQGLVTLRLVAQAADISIDHDAAHDLTKAMLNAYLAAAGDPQTTTDQLLQDPVAWALFEAAGGKSYSEALVKCIGPDGKFRSTIESKGKLKELLRPIDLTDRQLADGIAQAIGNRAELQTRFRLHSPAAIRKIIVDAAVRTRIGSSGSQGQRKIFVLLRKPLQGLDHDLILYLKQEIPTAVERAGVIAPEKRSPGQRTSDDIAALQSPLPFINSWCEIAGVSYWVTFHDPWSEELDYANVKSWPDLLHYARLWGAFAGATHHTAAAHAIIAKRLPDPALAGRLQALSAEYLGRLNSDYRDFISDPRTKKCVIDAERAIMGESKASKAGR